MGSRRQRHHVLLIVVSKAHATCRTPIGLVQSSDCCRPCDVPAAIVIQAMHDCPLRRCSSYLFVWLVCLLRVTAAPEVMLRPIVRWVYGWWQGNEAFTTYHGVGWCIFLGGERLCAMIKHIGDDRHQGVACASRTSSEGLPPLLVWTKREGPMFPPPPLRLLLLSYQVA